MELKHHSNCLHYSYCSACSVMLANSLHSEVVELNYPLRPKIVELKPHSLDTITNSISEVTQRFQLHCHLTSQSWLVSKYLCPSTATLSTIKLLV